MTQAEIDILAERKKQRVKWGPDHDKDHDDGALGAAAALLSWPDEYEGEDGSADKCMIIAPGWAWELLNKHIDDRRKQLVIAAALLIAEVERIDRASAPKPEATTPERRRCNRHDDCDAADATADAHENPRPDHCHDDECPDCFGD